MRTVRAALIQAHASMSKQAAVDKHIAMIAGAASQGARVIGLQEIFHGPYFRAEQDAEQDAEQRRPARNRVSTTGCT